MTRQTICCISACMRRVVISGKAAVSPIGWERDIIVTALREGTRALVRPDFAPHSAIAPVTGFDSVRVIGRDKLRRYLSRAAHLGVSAAMLAVRDSRLREPLPEDTALFYASGPNMNIAEELPRGVKSPPSGLWILKFLLNTPTSFLARKLDIHGENATIASACAASLHAMGEAYRRIAWSVTDVALAGGADSRVSESAFLAYAHGGVTWQGEKLDYAPFHGQGRGMVPGEGAGFLVLEEASRARARLGEDAILWEIVGFSASLDGASPTAMDPTLTHPRRAVLGALGDMDPGDIDLIVAHGTGTQVNDTLETRLIIGIFGPSVPVVVLKERIGHSAAVSGAQELALVLMALESGFVPHSPAPFGPAIPNVVKEPLPSNGINTVLIQNFGFGGQNAALVLRRCN